MRLTGIQSVLISILHPPTRERHMAFCILLPPSPSVILRFAISISDRMVRVAFGTTKVQDLGACTGGIHPVKFEKFLDRNGFWWDTALFWDKIVWWWNDPEDECYCCPSRFCNRT
jgi:hypothetical protein